MPTYEYKCKACGHAFDEFQSITAPLLKKCPSCGKNKLERLFGIGAAVVFKGGGFYQTDYRSEGYKKAAEADKKSSEGGTSAPAASDAKAAPANANNKTEASTDKPAASKPAAPATPDKPSTSAAKANKADSKPAKTKK